MLEKPVWMGYNNIYTNKKNSGLERIFIVKKDVRREESLIFAIYNKRHNTNEIVLALPFILVLLFVIIGVPILVAVCNLSYRWIPLLIFGPLLCVTAFYGIRKKIIIDGFIRIKDISDRVEIAETQADDLKASAEGRVLLFAYSEYMKTILYNWFSSLNVIGNGKLKLYHVFYDNYTLAYLAICEAELHIPEESRENYEKETRMCLQMSDTLHGKIVNEKLYARVTGNEEEGK